MWIIRNFGGDYKLRRPFLRFLYGWWVLYAQGKPCRQWNGVMKKMEWREKHITFLIFLRIWLVGDDRQPHWRASLEDTHTGERKGYASQEAQFEYFEQQIRSNAG
jgi:hypothetical protein